MKKEENYTNRHKKPKPFESLTSLTSLFYSLAIANISLGIVGDSLKKSGLLK